MLEHRRPPNCPSIRSKGVLALSVAMLSSALLIGPASASVVTQTSQPAPPTATTEELSPSFQEEFVSLVDQDEIYSHVQELSVGIGPRVAGTAAEDAAQDYVEEHLEQYGFETSREEFEGRTQYIANAVPSRDLPGIASWQYRSANGSLITGSSEAVSAEVIDLGDGSGLQDTDVTDAFVIVDWVAEAEARSVLLSDIATAGAAGIILAQPNPTGRIPSLQEVPASLSDLIVVAAGGVQSERLRELTASDGEPFSLSISTEQTRDDSSNVIGVRPAANDDGTAPIIYIGAHVDSVVGSPGASDNASGIGIMLEISKIISDYSLDTEIRVGSWGGEEIGILGSAHHAQSLSEDEIQRTIGAWNMDMAGTAEKGTDEQPFGFWGLSVNPDNDLNTVLNFADEVHTDLKDDPLNIGYVGRSDHQSFHDVGINAAVFSWMFWSADSSIVLEPHYHLPSDTIEFVSAERMGFSAQVIGGSAFRAAMNPITVNVVDETGQQEADAQVTMSCDDGVGWREFAATSELGLATSFAPHTTCDFKAVAANGAMAIAHDQQVVGETVIDLALVLDEAAPKISMTTEGETGSNGWFVQSPVTLNITATDDIDGSPVVEYSFDDSTWQQYTQPVALDAEGEHLIYIRATDATGNTASTSTTINLDSVAPSLDAEAIANSPGKIRVVAADETSGLDGVEYRVNAEDQWTKFEAEQDQEGALLGEVPVGSEGSTVELRAADVAGNSSVPVVLELLGPDNTDEERNNPTPTPDNAEPDKNKDKDKDLAQTGTSTALKLSLLAGLLFAAAGVTFAIRKKIVTSHKS